MRERRASRCDQRMARPQRSVLAGRRRVPCHFALTKTRCLDVFRSAATPNEEDLGPDRPDDERHGVDRAGGLPLADLRAAMSVRPAHGRLRGVVRHRGGPGVVLRHGHRLRRTLEALSRRRLVVFLRRAGVSLQDAGLPLRPPGQVHRRLGQPHVLLGLSGGDGGRDRHPRRLPGRPTLAGHVQQHHQQPHVDDRLLRAVFLRGRLYRLPRRQRDHRRERGRQRDPDRRAAAVFGHRHRLPDEPPERRPGLQLDPDGNADQQRAGNGQGRQAHQGRKDRPVQVRAGEGQRQAVSPGVQRHRHYPGAGRQGQAQRRETGHLPVPHLGPVGHQAARLQLRDHPGVHRHPDPGGIRVGHLPGRGGEERQARHPPRRAAVAIHSRGGLLSDRVFRRRLLSQSRLHVGGQCGQLQRPDRRHDGPGRHSGSSAARRPAGGSCSSRPSRCSSP